MKAAILVIVLHGQATCEPYIRGIPVTADAYCIAGDLAPLTSPRPIARPSR